MRRRRSGKRQQPGGLPERMNMALVEPLRELFKDEVRALGRELGLPQAFVGRHPFPGPGLAIRCPGEVTREKLEILRRADDIYIQEIRRAGLYVEIWQAFAVLLPVRTVGVMGDFRTYDYVVGLRAVTSTDGMTADFYPFDMKFIGHVATRIVNEVKGVGRACDGLFLCPCELRFTAPPRSRGAWCASDSVSGSVRRSSPICPCEGRLQNITCYRLY